MKARHLFISFVLGLGLTTALLWSLENPSSSAAPRTELRVCFGGCDYSHVQDAVDAAHDGDVIKVATGTYTDLVARNGVTQVVYVSKTVTIRGGYAITDWITPDPNANPTTLDAQGQGRVFYVTEDVSPTIEGLRITGGDATGLGGSFWGYHDTGGGVYAISATVTLVDNQIFGNTAHLGGGVGAVNAAATIMNSQVSSNTAQSSGGGIYVVNAFEDDGDGTNVISITVTAVGNRVFGNTARQGSGGGLYVVNQVDTWIDYFGNITAIISDNVVFGNVAGYGAGLYLAESTVTLTGNTFASNAASYDGGGLMLVHCMFCPAASLPPVLDGNTITANRAGYEGGGVYLGYHSAVFNGNVIISNTADYGGGLYARFGGGTFINTVVVDNRADVAGSGFYFVGSHAHLLYSTIAHNHGGDGSGICASWYGTGSVLISNRIALTNTIIAGQTVGITMTGYYTGPWGDAATLDSVLWFGNEANISGTVSITVSHAYTGDPAFAANGYHLTAGSAAIDKGVSAGVFTDIDGEPRPPNAGSDLGADEFPAALVVDKQASPTTVEGGERLTYTIRITNTGSADLHATITDTLPAHITPGQTPEGSAIVPGGQITWTTAITAPGGVWTETVVVTVEESYRGPLVNVVEVKTKEGAAGSARALVNFYEIYLPLVMRS